MRGDTKRFSFKRSVIPLFEEALERALILAESMEARGYGYSHKSRNLEGKRNLAPTFIMLVGTGTLLLSILQMLIGAKYHVTLFIALGALGLGLTLGNKANSRSKYRPIPWRKEELLVITASLGAILITIIATKTFNALLALALLFACAAPLFVTSGRQRA
jgi:energy-coupling factor transport system permease protein